jgi:hypothetical protein
MKMRGGIPPVQSNGLIAAIGLADARGYCWRFERICDSCAQDHSPV